jgi:hypothetical protein
MSELREKHLFTTTSLPPVEEGDFVHVTGVRTMRPWWALWRPKFVEGRTYKVISVSDFSVTATSLTIWDRLRSAIKRALTLLPHSNR